MKNLYSLQSHSVIKPVRFLSREHVFPENLEKMNVQKVVGVYSLPVTAALVYAAASRTHL